MDNSEKPVDFLKQKDVFGFDMPISESEKEAEPMKRGADTIAFDEYKDFKFPSLMTRIMALFIDLILILTIFFLTAYLIELFGDIQGWLKGVIMITMIFLYEPIFVTLFGCTAGHYLLKLRVRSIKSSSKNISIIHAFIRFFFKSILGWVSFLTVTFNKRKRAIHDIVSGSIVIHV